jgi:hypothetical protein
MSPSPTGPGSWTRGSIRSGPLRAGSPRNKMRLAEKPFSCPHEVLPKRMAFTLLLPNNGVRPCGQLSTLSTANIAGRVFPRCGSSVWLTERNGQGIAAYRSSRALAPSGVGVKGCARLLPRGGAAHSSNHRYFNFMQNPPVSGKI